MWRELGERTGMILDQSRKVQLFTDAGVESEDSPLIGYLPEASPDQKANPTIMKQRDAITALFFYRQHRQLTNFPHYLGTAQGEQLPETIRARKLLWQASQARRVAQTSEAVRLYKQGLELWKQVLIDNAAFHRPDRSDHIEEETYEFELEYLRLLIVSRDKAVWDKGQEEYAKVIAQIGTCFPLIGTATQLPTAAQFDWNYIIAQKFFAPFGGMISAADFKDKPVDIRVGTPWIKPETKSTIQGRQGIATQPAPGGPPAPPPQPPPSRPK